MSILEDEETLMDSIGNTLMKTRIREFINNQMADYSSKNYNYYSNSPNKNGLISLNWLEVETKSFNINPHGVTQIEDEYVFPHPVEKNQICTLSDIYESIDNKLLVVPRCPAFPMLLSGCYYLPDYIEFFSPKSNLEIFTFHCSEEVTNIIERIEREFYYGRSNINKYDQYILSEIYLSYGEYNSSNPKIVAFEKALKDKLLFNIKKYEAF